MIMMNSLVLDVMCGAQSPMMVLFPPAITQGALHGAPGLGTEGPESPGDIEGDEFGLCHRRWPLVLEVHLPRQLQLPRQPHVIARFHQLQVPQRGQL